MQKLIAAGVGVLAVVGLVVLGVWEGPVEPLEAAAGEGEAAAQPGEPCYKPVVPMDLLMELVGDTFDDAVEQLKAKKYAKLHADAYALAEYMNVLQFHKSDEVQGEEKMKNWKRIALAIRDEMVKTAAAAKRKDDAAAKALLDGVESTCEQCHDMRD